MNHTLEKLFLDELSDMYYAEKQLTKALPKMAKAAASDTLREAIESHLEETEGHVHKVEDVFKAFDKPPKAKKCEAMLGLISEGERIASDNKGEPTIDAAVISAAQKVEHYEIASYGCLREWAEQLENSEAATLLEEILDQEKAADTKLTDLARESCNESAQQEENGEEDEPTTAKPAGRSRARR